MIGKGQGISSYQFIIADAVVVSYITLGYRTDSSMIKLKHSHSCKSEVKAGLVKRNVSSIYRS
jgi:hypothetical protein